MQMVPEVYLPNPTKREREREREKGRPSKCYRPALFSPRRGVNKGSRSDLRIHISNYGRFLTKPYSFWIL